MKRLHLVLLLAAVALVQFLVQRAVHVSTPHPGGDNAAYVALGHAMATGQGYVETWDPALIPHTKYPPAWPAVLALAEWSGARTWVDFKRLPFALSWLGVVLIWTFVARRRGAIWASAVALGSGLSYAWLTSSSWLFSEPLFVALCAAFWWTGEHMRSPDSDGRAARWVGAAAVMAVLAILTRSAGLPLAVALVAATLLNRSWRQAALASLIVGVPSLLWFLRGQGVEQEGAYAREFWMVNPYRPELGEIGIAGLVVRALDNASLYLTEWLPRSFGGDDVGVTGALVLLLALLALLGWGRAMKHRAGLAEWFAPSYAGLILLWPSIWGGERFALPLIPLILLWAGEGLEYLVLRAAASRIPDVSARRRFASVAVAAASISLLVPLGQGMSAAARQASDCRRAAEIAGPWACGGPPMVEFTEAAMWSGANLPADAVVLTRKPRIWHAMSGLSSRTYPFVANGDTLLLAADRAGARYVVLDLVASQADLLAQAIGLRLGAFCSIAAFGRADGGLRTELLGVLPPEQRDLSRRADQDDAVVRACPDTFVAVPGQGTALSANPLPYEATSPIPLLTLRP
jgi:hypothetical protein